MLARGLVEAGHEVRAVGLYSISYPAPGFEEDQGVKVWRYRLPESPLGRLSARRNLFKLLRSWSRSGAIELIEVPDLRGPAAGWRTLPVPVVARLSGSASYLNQETGRRPHAWEFIRERASLRRADFICSISRYIGEGTQAAFRLRSTPTSVIYPPVKIPVLDPDIQRDPHMVVFAGALTERTGVISLVKSWPDVKKGFPEATLHIWGKDGGPAGCSSMQQHLRSLLPESVKQDVHFHGHVPLDELLLVFQRAGIAVLPSYAEGFALTPLHAMAAGCPTLYTKRGCGPELIANPDTGLLVDPDRPCEIASSILSLLRERNLAASLGEKGRRLVEERFSWSALRAANEDFYNYYLKQFRPTNPS
jgi:glycosyltransferase involved in cell wall biosynthesis